MVERGVAELEPDARAAPSDEPPRRRVRVTAYGVVLLLVVSIQPFAGFVAENVQEELPIGALAGYAGAVFAVALLAWMALTFLLPRVTSEVLATAVAVVVFCFFKASLILNTYPRGTIRYVQPVIWGLVVTLLILLAVRAAAVPMARTFLLTFLAIWAAISVLAATIALAGASRGDPDDIVQADLAFVPIEGEAVNVYWFVFDEYGRNDQLERFAGIDNTEFYAELEARGFAVSASSRTSYARTHLSMSSTLAMDYVVQPGTEVTQEFRALAPVFGGENATVDRFREHGYRYLFADQGMLPWASCDESLADVCIPAASKGIDDVQLSLLKLTPLGGFPFDRPHTDPLDVIERVDALDIDELSPFFLFAHINAPHFPYRFGPGCEFRTEPVSSAPLDVQEWRAYYGQEIACLNEHILEGVDRIIAADPDAIIVLQSDHGSASSVDWTLDPDEWTPEMLQERFAVLNAMRLPSGCDDDIEGAPLVNTFRVVFACLEGTEPELLEHRAFLAPWDDIGAIEELEPERFDER